MHIQARRVFRLSLTAALALAIGYGLQLPLAFLAPLFAVMLSVKPAPPIGMKGLFGLIIVVSITLGIGLLLIPLLAHYPFTALLLVTLGLYLSFYLTINMGKALVGMFLTVGFTLISAMGTIDFGLAVELIKALVLGIALAIICQWIVYPWFPEDPVSAGQDKPPSVGAEQCNWVALRATIIILPVYILVLINPTFYVPIMMKGVSLAQQSSTMTARNAGRELLGSTFLSGFFAILFWMLLSIFPHLWMFFLWMLLFGIYFSGKIYQLIPTRFPSSFWLNVVVTMLILLGPAVGDSDTGKDVYTAFFIRMSLFVLVTFYAVYAVYLLEYLRGRHQSKALTLQSDLEVTT
ncbi:MAG: DUF2955 domain-containing protein [Gammaproteobacteria bacterium]|nr:MAG: DUF2955 domain-containing protein [Gammaproteobacteria bacterium]